MTSNALEIGATEKHHDSPFDDVTRLKEKVAALTTNLTGECVVHPHFNKLY